MDVAECLECIESNREMIVGIKVRLSAQLANNGRNEKEAYRLLSSSTVLSSASSDYGLFLVLIIQASFVHQFTG